MTRYQTTDVLGAADLDAAWFTGLLRHHGRLEAGSVVDVTSEPFGTGQMAESHRFRLTFDDAASGPASLVVKLPSQDPGSREFGATRGLYEAEVRFYKELAGAVQCAVPVALHSAIAAGGDFTLVMDDLAPARVVDQIAGAEVDDVAAAVEELARLHAGSWGWVELAERPWLRSIVHGYVAVLDQADALVAMFEEKFGDVVPAEDIDQLRALAAAVPEWTARLQEVRCLWHQDFRLDNLLFDANGGRTRVAVVDWQTVGMANGVIDLPYLLGSSLTVERRRASERDLVALYHRTLVAHGVTDYDADQCWDDYRVLAAHGLASLLVGAVSVVRTPRGDEMWRTWAQRQAAQTRDLDTFALLAAGRASVLRT